MKTDKFFDLSKKLSNIEFNGSDNDLKYKNQIILSFIEKNFK